MSIVISIGRFGGFGIRRGKTIAPLNGRNVGYVRLILGWMSLIFFAVDLDLEWTKKKQNPVLASVAGEESK